ncbi:AbfB domain-containing protein [Streptomyces collinus]|uniref:AbfB domain-containing protein n=1 Tax=Streptomyces collinus TaxID=42684 RepID=UPI0037AA3086
MGRALNRTLRAVHALLTSVTALLGLTTFAGTAGAAHPPTGQATRYTMTAFTNGSESNMYVYDSPDATGFTLRKGPAYTPPSGLIRDPSIFKHADGLYYLTYTTNWTGNTIGFARSTDRVNWTFLYNHTIPVSGLTRTWAPEWFIDTDGSVNVIVSLTSASTATHFTGYKITATNSALTAWSTPAQLAGIGPNYIDTFVVKVGSTYHAFTKNETTKYIEYATASSLTEPAVAPGLADANCYSFRDSAGRYLRHWDHRIRFDSSSGTAVFDEDATYCARPGATAGSVSLETYNYPGRYLRHYNYVLRMDLYQNTDTFRADSSFTGVSPWA